MLVVFSFILGFVMGVYSGRYLFTKILMVPETKLKTKKVTIKRPKGIEPPPHPALGTPMQILGTYAAPNANYTTTITTAQGTVGPIPYGNGLNEELNNMIERLAQEAFAQVITPQDIDQLFGRQKKPKKPKKNLPPKPVKRKPSGIEKIDTVDL